MIGDTFWSGVIWTLAVIAGIKLLVYINRLEREDRLEQRGAERWDRWS